MITRTKTYKEKAPKRAKTELEKLKAKAKREKCESQFYMMWRALDGPLVAREHTFHPDRKWRFDFAELRSKVAIEIEGGTWSGGRHTRGSGYSADCEKYNEATRLGWRVFRLTPGMITAQHVEAIMRVINATSYNT